VKGHLTAITIHCALHILVQIYTSSKININFFLSTQFWHNVGEWGGGGSGSVAIITINFDSEWR
jgi:hypothetical protein